MEFVEAIINSIHNEVDLIMLEKDNSKIAISKRFNNNVLSKLVANGWSLLSKNPKHVTLTVKEFLKGSAMGAFEAHVVFSSLVKQSKISLYIGDNISGEDRAFDIWEINIHYRLDKTFREQIMNFLEQQPRFRNSFIDGFEVQFEQFLAKIDFLQLVIDDFNK